MAEASIVDRVEALAERLVFTEPTDLPALAEIHTEFEQLGSWASGNDLPQAASAMEKCAGFVESIILEEAEDVQAAWGAVSGAVGALQTLVRDGREPAQVEWPAALGLCAHVAAGAESGAAASGEEVGERASGAGGAREGDAAGSVPGIEISPLVDERIVSEFVSRQSSALEDLESLILELESIDDADKKAELRRFVHTLKGEAGLVGFMDMAEVCHAAEDTVDSYPTPEITDILLDVKDWLSRDFDAFLGKCAAPERGKVLIDRLRNEPTGPRKAPATAPPDGAEPAPAVAPQAPPEEGVVDAPPAQAEAVGAEETGMSEPRQLTGDPELLGEFVAEAMEHLDNSDAHLLTLETDAKDDEALNAVFRAFHTIKGVAGFLELPNIQKLAHESENLLDRARKGQLELSGEPMDLAFEAVDVMKRMVNRVAAALQSGSPMEPEDALPALLTKLGVYLESGGNAPKAPRAPTAKAAAKPEAGGKKLGEILVAEGKVSAEDIDKALAAQGDAGREIVGELCVRANLISRKQLDDALEQQRSSGGGKRLGEILLESGLVRQQDFEQILAKQEDATKPKLGELLVRQGVVPAKDVADALRVQRQATAPAQKMEVREAVRVDADRLDRLVDLVGELVIAESMVSQSPETLKNASPRMRAHLSELDKITRELQEMGMSLRMVPVRATFQKMARLVRDLGKKAGKQVEFSMKGEDTELDKSVVDKIGDPLVHMIRNAVDHGLEATTEDRVRAGKPPAGHVQLRAYHKAGNIHIEIADDGRGLDRDAILRKAKERGLLKDNETLSDKEVWNLIFEAGFSTAKQITDVSGRGVGMDVVRRNIESLRGLVDIHSEKGKGSVFNIRLPLTLAIIDGMVVRVGQERYIIPTLSVVRSVQPEEKELHSVVRQGEMLSLQGQLLPMFRLDELFGVGGAMENPTEALVVIVEDDGKQAGILVDELLGQQQIVIKSLGAAMSGIQGLSGGAIMPDGSVGLIVDVSGLVRVRGVGGREGASRLPAAGQAEGAKQG